MLSLGSQLSKRGSVEKKIVEAGIMLGSIRRSDRDQAFRQEEWLQWMMFRLVAARKMERRSVRNIIRNSLGVTCGKGLMQERLLNGVAINSRENKFKDRHVAT